jgi:hypothetical protein
VAPKFLKNVCSLGGGGGSSSSSSSSSSSHIYSRLGDAPALYSEGHFSNLVFDTVYTDLVYSWFCSVSTGKSRYSICDRPLPLPALRY